LQAQPPPSGAYEASGGDFSSSTYTIPHLWGNTFEANPHTRPYHSIYYPGEFKTVSHAGETLYGC